MQKRNYQKELDAIIESDEEAGIKPRLLMHSCCAPCSSYVMEYLRKYFRLTMFFYNPNMDSEAEYAKRADELKRLIDCMNNESGNAHTDSQDSAKNVCTGSQDSAQNVCSVHCICADSSLDSSTVDADIDRSVSGSNTIYGKHEGHSRGQGEPEPMECSDSQIGLITADYDPESFMRIAKGHESDPERGERCMLCYRLRLQKTAEYMQAHNGEFDYFATTLTLSPLKNAEALNTIAEELASEYGLKSLPTDFKKRNGYKRSIELSNIYGLYRQNYCGCAFSRADALKRDSDRRASEKEAEENSI